MKKVFLPLLVALATGTIHQVVNAYTWHVTNNSSRGWGFRLHIGLPNGPLSRYISRTVDKDATNDFNGTGGEAGFCLVGVDYQKVLGDNNTWTSIKRVGTDNNRCGNESIIIRELLPGQLTWEFKVGYTITVVSQLSRGIGIRLNFSGDHRTATLDAGATVQLHGGLGLCLTDISYMEADVWSQPGASDKKSNWKNMSWSKVAEVVAPIGAAMGGVAGAGASVTAGATIVGAVAGASDLAADTALAGAAAGAAAGATALAPVAIGAGIVAAAVGVGLGAYILSELCRDRTIRIFDDGTGKPLWDFQ
ncbi:MAG: hypothetical protein WCE21_05170 [Candidatus Babeliales bacterium]